MLYEDNDRRISDINNYNQSLNEIFSSTKTNVNTLLSLIEVIKNQSLDQNYIKFLQDATNLIASSNTTGNSAITTLFNNFRDDVSDKLNKMSEVIRQTNMVTYISSNGSTEALRKMYQDVKKQYDRVNSTYNNLKSITKATQSTDRVGMSNGGSTNIKIFNKTNLELYCDLNHLFHKKANLIPSEVLSIWNETIKYEIIMTLAKLPNDHKTMFIPTIHELKTFEDPASYADFFKIDSYAHYKTQLVEVEQEMGQVLNKFYLMISSFRKKLEGNFKNTVLYEYYFPIAEPSETSTSNQVSYFKPLFRNFGNDLGLNTGSGNMKNLNDANSSAVFVDTDRNLKVGIDTISGGFGVSQISPRPLRPEDYLDPEVLKITRGNGIKRGLGNGDKMEFDEFISGGNSKRSKLDSSTNSYTVGATASQNQEVFNKITNLITKTKNRLDQIGHLATKEIMQALTDKYLIFHNIIINKQLFTNNVQVWTIDSIALRDSIDLSDGVISYSANINFIKTLATNIKSYFEGIKVKFDKASEENDGKVTFCRTADSQMILNISNLNSLITQVLTNNNFSKNTLITKFNDWDGYTGPDKFTIDPADSYSVIYDATLDVRQSLLETKKKSTIELLENKIQFYDCLSTILKHVQNDSVLKNLYDKYNPSSKLKMNLPVSETFELLKILNEAEIIFDQNTMNVVTTSRGNVPGILFYYLLFIIINRESLNRTEFNNLLTSLLAKHPEETTSEMLDTFNNPQMRNAFKNYSDRKISSSYCYVDTPNFKESNDAKIALTNIKNMIRDFNEHKDGYALGFKLSSLSTSPNVYDFILYNYYMNSSIPLLLGSHDNYEIMDSQNTVIPTNVYFLAEKPRKFGINHSLDIVVSNFEELNDVKFTKYTDNLKKYSNNVNPTNCDTENMKKFYRNIDIATLLIYKNRLFKNSIITGTDSSVERSINLIKTYISPFIAQYKDLLNEGTSKVLKVKSTITPIETETNVLSFMHRTLLSKSFNSPRSIDIQVLGPSGVGKSHFLYGQSGNNNGILHAMNGIEGEVRIVELHYKSFMYGDSIKKSFSNPREYIYSNEAIGNGVAVVKGTDKNYNSGFKLTTFKNNFSEVLNKVADIRRNENRTVKPTRNNPDSSRSILLVSVELTINGNKFYRNFVDKPGSEGITTAEKTIGNPNKNALIFMSNPILGAAVFANRVILQNNVNKFGLNNLKYMLPECLLALHPLGPNGRMIGVLENIPDVVYMSSRGKPAVFARPIAPGNSEIATKINQYADKFYEIVAEVNMDKLPGRTSIIRQFYHNVEAVNEVYKVVKEYYAPFEIMINQIYTEDIVNNFCTFLKAPIPEDFKNLQINIDNVYSSSRLFKKSGTIGEIFNFSGMLLFENEILRLSEDKKHFKNTTPTFMEYITFYKFGLIYPLSPAYEKDVNINLGDIDFDTFSSIKLDTFQSYMVLHQNKVSLLLSLLIYYYVYRVIDSTIDETTRTELYIDIVQGIFDLRENFTEECNTIAETIAINELNNQSKETFSKPETQTETANNDPRYHIPKSLGDLIAQTFINMADNNVIEYSNVNNYHFLDNKYNSFVFTIGLDFCKTITKTHDRNFDSMVEFDNKCDILYERTLRKYFPTRKITTPQDFNSSVSSPNSEFLKSKSFSIKDSNNLNVLVLNSKKANDTTSIAPLTYANIFD